MTLAALLLFGHLYAPGSNTPAYTFPSRFRRTADFGYTLKTAEWQRLSLAHTMTNYTTTWSTGEPRMGAVRYEVELRLRVGQMSLTAGHESWHNVDIGGPTTSFNRVGVELEVAK